MAMALSRHRTSTGRFRRFCSTSSTQPGVSPMAVTRPRKRAVPAVAAMRTRAPSGASLNFIIGGPSSLGSPLRQAASRRAQRVSW